MMEQHSAEWYALALEKSQPRALPTSWQRRKADIVPVAQNLHGRIDQSALP